MVDLMNKWRRASARLSAELGREPTAEEAARLLAIPQRQVTIIKKALRVYRASHCQAGSAINETILDHRESAPGTEMIDRENLAQAMSIMSSVLDDREATILRLRFGLQGRPPMNLPQIGAALGITRERVRQIEAEALGKIYQRMEYPSQAS
jgi:RNA polymerase primary sigma factor